MTLPPRPHHTPPLTNPWVIIPTYNEINNIERMIHQLFALPIKNLTVLVVDDNSPDQTAKQVEKMQNDYHQLKLKIRAQKTGLGKAYQDGFTIALENNASALVQMDADFSHDPAEVPKLLENLNSHDLVIGSRYSKGISVINWPLKRLLISMAGNIYASMITGLPYKDVTGGFKAWRADTLKEIQFETIEADGYGFQVATTYRAWKQQKNIIEVPIVFTERREGQSKMSQSIVFEAIVLMWKLRFFDHH